MKRTFGSRNFLSFWLLLLALLISSCASPSASVATKTPTLLSGAKEAYPVDNNISAATMYPEMSDPQLEKLKTAVPPDQVMDPEPGKASIAGVVYSDTIKRVLPKTMFYLTPAIGKDKNEIPPAFVGPLPEKGDIVSKTDQDGKFSLSNIPPGNYILLVEAPYNWSVAQEGENNFKPLIIKLNANQKENLRIVYVSWP